MEETSDETAEDQSPLWVTGTEGQFIKKIKSQILLNFCLLMSDSEV